MKNNTLIYLVSFFSGFLSLSQEIIWMRIISFAGMTVPQAFSYTLGLFLLGIAIGAHIGKLICKNTDKVTINLLGKCFFVASIFDLLIIFLTFNYIKFFGSSILVLGLAVLLCALVRGIVFPLVHHIGTHESKTGNQISNVYFSNVLGSAIAPLLISFILLDFLSTQQVYIVICLLTMAVASACISEIKLRSLTIVILAFVSYCISLPDRFIKELAAKDIYNEKYPHILLENKHGFIQVYKDGTQDTVYGANVYDGKFNTNIFNNSNGIDRAYFLTAIQPDAKNVLVVGLSTGSWVQVLSYLPNVEKITIVEINPAYKDFIKQFPEVASILNDPRIEIITDDGRKWLKKNEAEKFDIILMNTTWHWRAYASNLLSKNFLEIVSNSLNKDGVVFYNTTESLDAYYTANIVFSNVYKYRYMVLASNTSKSFNHILIENNLCKLINAKKEIVFSKDECKRAAEIVLRQPIQKYEEIDFSKLGRQLEIITDNNMITEYKYGKGL